MCFAEALLFLLLFVLPSPLLELCPAVLCHLRCCVCHICTACAVVPGVSRPLCVVFFEVAVYFLLLLLLLRRCGSVLLWCLLVAGVVSWFCGLLGVLLLRAGVCCCWCVLVLLFFFCWFCFVLGCPLFCGPPGVFCSSWLFWFVVSPVRCTVLVLVAPGWFMRLVVLFGGRSSGVALSAVSGASRSSSFVFLLRV